MSQVIPEIFDGFGFFWNKEQDDVEFFFFDDMSQKHGVLPGPEGIPADRTAYHVILQCARHGRVHIEEPFTSNFLDAFVYAKHVAEAGFKGFMIKVNQFSLALLEASLVETLKTHRNEYGFVMRDDKGIDVFYPGRKKMPTTKEKSN